MSVTQILISFFVTLLLLLIFLKTRLVNIALDKPNARSLHTNHTPRIGGLALVMGVLIAGIFSNLGYLWIALILALMLISLVDDIRGLPVLLRLLAQVTVSAIFSLLFLPDLVWWLFPIAVISLVWMTNLYNFMDGSDGLAGGMGVAGFTVYAIACYWVGDAQLASMSASVASACLAFLIFNFHPAKIFMGDAGSIPLGFLSGAIGLYGWQHGLWRLWLPILVFSPFIVDATVTLFKRFLRGERLSEAHRCHYYQRLVQMGFGHRNTAIYEYLLMFMVGISAIVMLKSTLIWIVSLLLFWVIVFVLLMMQIDKQWKHYQHFR